MIRVDMIMRKIVTMLLAALLSCLLCNAQRISDSGYRTVGFIKSDGTVQDSGYSTIGHIKPDGTVQDASYRTIGHAKDIPMSWAALYFFFRP